MHKSQPCQTRSLWTQPRIAEQSLHRQIITCRRKIEQSTTKVNWHNLACFTLCPLTNFLKKHDVSKTGSVSTFRQRRTSPGGPVNSSYFLSLVTIVNSKLVKIRTWEQTESKGSNRKKANEKLKINQRLKNKNRTNPQIKNYKKNH